MEDNHIKASSVVKLASWHQESEKGHFRHGSNKMPDTDKISRNEALRINKGRKAVAFDQRVEAEQWERPNKGGKEGISRRKGQANSNPDGEEDGTEGPMVIEAEVGGHLVHRISHSSYNGIIGRPGVRRIKAIPSTAHEMLKFPVTGGTVTLWSSKIIPLECAMISGPRMQQPVVDQVTEEKIQVAIHLEYPEQTIAIGSTLTEEGRKKLCGLLRQNIDIVAWKPADMTGVLRHIAEHRLNVREGYFPVRQKKRGQAPKRNKAICEEVEKLVNADFKDLNKACTKDGYPLPEIDWKVESLCGYPFKCFLDVYKGYHQIKMAKEDEEKTAFITSQGIFCYSKMLFGLKNAGATYQRLVDKAFQKQIGRNLEAYVDDLVIKSCTEQEVSIQIRRKVTTLHQNSKKCTKKSDFQWTTKAETAFQQMKKSIAELPMMAAPQEKEELIIYLAAAKEAISAVLMTERDGKQIPIYFVSRALRGPEINYTPMEKLVLALVSASKRLKRYIQAHTIIVITDQPIKQMLSNSKVMGRLLK
ncbi:reverse transcriptase domain-containing protein [Tanacetum coccineum]